VSRPLVLLLLAVTYVAELLVRIYHLRPRTVGLIVR